MLEIRFNLMYKLLFGGLYLYEKCKINKCRACPKNCELIQISGEHILEYRQPCIAFQSDDGTIDFSEIYMKISKKARVTERQLYMMGYCDEERDTFERILSGQDICHIFLQYENYANMYCHVPFSFNMSDLALGEDSYRLDEDGNLIIHLKSTPKLEERLLSQRFINFNLEPLVENGIVNKDFEDEYLDDDVLDDDIDV